MQENLFRKAQNADTNAIQHLVFKVLREYGLEPDSNSTDADLNNIEANYFKTGGTFLVIINDQREILGTGGILPHSKTYCELRKMYLDKSIRGKGLGLTLLTKLINQAKELGFTHITLETASVLKEAIELYQSVGFKPFSPPHLSPRCDQAFQLDLHLFLDPNQK